MIKSNNAQRRAIARQDSTSDYVARRNEIITIAAELFRENGFAATRPLDIAKRAGIDRATLYYYVGGKKEIFRESLADIITADIDEAKALLEMRDLSSSERLARLIGLLMRGYATSYPQMFLYIQEQMVTIDKDSSEWGRKLQTVTRDYETIVMMLIQDGLENGEFRDDLDPTVIMYSLFGMTNWTHRWFQPDGRLDYEEVSRNFSEIFLHGISKT